MAIEVPCRSVACRYSIWMSTDSAASPFIFLFSDTATTEIYTLSLHDALPIWIDDDDLLLVADDPGVDRTGAVRRDRKSTRLNSSHVAISYAVFCLKKKRRHPVLPDHRLQAPERRLPPRAPLRDREGHARPRPE